ncbi:MAG: hypothetical protein U0401_16995 [Anaerolineae bacterium]
MKCVGTRDWMGLHNHIIGMNAWLGEVGIPPLTHQNERGRLNS